MIFKRARVTDYWLVVDFAVMNRSTWLLMHSAAPLRLWPLLIAVCLLTAAYSTSQAQQPVSIKKVPVPAKPAPIQVVPKSDRRDVMLMLDTGPIHIRLNMALGGQSLEQCRRQFVNDLIEKLDQDKDGKVSRTEANRSPLFRTKQRPGAAQFVQSLKSQGTLSRRDIEQNVERWGGEIVAYRQDLSSSKNDVEVFKLLDKDGSGTLDSSELQTARDVILSKDTDGDECVAFQEFLPQPDPNAMATPVLAVGAGTTPVPLASVADIIRDLHEPLLPQRLLRKYDKKRDLQLDSTELGWAPERLEKCDADRNGKLDAAELAHLTTDSPDVELSVDLRIANSDGGKLTVPTFIGKRMDDADRPDYAKVAFGASVITFSLRNLDPIATALETAMREFNLLDADANGYLDKTEAGMRGRFERSLFEIIDVDGDNKLFADEMKDYIRARTEPAATACRMNVYDTGNGFFMALDANADGRVSVRETRQAAEALSQLDRDGKPGITQAEPVRHFHIEFVRGGYTLFGPTEQLVAMTPAFQQRRPTGPVWFQRMDRNNDGDLTWNEFLGPREVFHKLDADVDTLIDPTEAAQSKK